MPGRRLIVTADDFGLCLAVNEAVEVACRQGILTCASLMMGEEATADAVARAQRLPGLRVGLHVVVVEARPVLSPAVIPALCDPQGRLDDHLVRAGVRFFFSRTAARQLEAEIRAQFAAFAKTGLALDHVNAHKHMHLHPTVLSLILRIGRDYGMRAVRLPYEVAAARKGVARRLSVSAALSRVVGLAVVEPWVRWMRWRLNQARLHHNDGIVGLDHSGAMDEHTVLTLLQHLPDGTTEMYFHPAVEDDENAQSLGYRKRAEFLALTSPRVGDALRHLGIPRLSFSDLG